jgi:hypothetical protein
MKQPDCSSRTYSKFTESQIESWKNSLREAKVNIAVMNAETHARGHAFDFYGEVRPSVV